MGIKITDYVVMSRRRPPQHDSGCWTEHHDRADAIECAERVNGKVFKRTDKDGQVKMRLIWSWRLA